MESLCHRWLLWVVLCMCGGGKRGKGLYAPVRMENTWDLNPERPVPIPALMCKIMPSK